MQGGSEEESWPAAASEAAWCWGWQSSHSKQGGCAAAADELLGRLTQLLGKVVICFLIDRHLSLGLFHSAGG